MVVAWEYAAERGAGRQVSHKSLGGGIFMIAWAVIAAVHGPLTALNWHGYTAKVLRLAERYRFSGTMTLGRARFIGTVLTVAAPLVLVLGLAIL
jgi:hypothetical protein